jgi:hypothetical protein
MNSEGSVKNIRADLMEGVIDVDVHNAGTKRVKMVNRMRRGTG